MFYNIYDYHIHIKSSYGNNTNLSNMESYSTSCFLDKLHGCLVIDKKKKIFSLISILNEGINSVFKDNIYFA